MIPSRTAFVGSALPLLILVGLVGLHEFPQVEASARAALGFGTDPAKVSITRPLAVPGVGLGAGRAVSADEAISLGRLRRSIQAGRELAFTGTEIVSGRRPGSSTTRVFDLVQRPGGVRTTTIRGAGGSPTEMSGPSSTIGSGGDELAGLTERALAALAAGYELRTAAPDRVAGRAASVVVVERDGREVARMWLDEQTGLMLRQDVLDRNGRLHRMAAFVDLQLDPGATTTALRTPVRTTSVGSRVAPAAWGEGVTSAELTALRADGWPCPAQLPAGFVLLDARRQAGSSGSTVQLTYGDGLSAISIFLQRGHLDGAGLTGLTSQKWDDADVYVRAGWPEVMVWQGGPTVITAVGDAEPADLRAVLSALPRQPDRGALDSLQDRMGSALAWFR